MIPYGILQYFIWLLTTSMRTVLTTLAHQGAKFLVKQFSTFNIAHLSKFVVNFNLIILFKPKYIVILTGLFCSIVAKWYFAFLLVLSVNASAGVDFWHDKLGLCLASQAQAKNDNEKILWCWWWNRKKIWNVKMTIFLMSTFCLASIWVSRYLSYTKLIMGGWMRCDFNCILVYTTIKPVLSKHHRKGPKLLV